MNKILLSIGIVLLLSFYTNRMQGQFTTSQDSIKIRPGDRIRLEVIGYQALVGKYNQKKGDSISVQIGRKGEPLTVFFPADQIIKLEVSQKPRFTPGQKILYGTLIGAAAGVLFGLVAPESPTLDNGGFYYWTRDGTVMLWGIIGAGGGLVTGTGLIIARQEIWTPATIDLKPTDPSKYLSGISIGWRIRFGK